MRQVFRQGFILTFAGLAAGLAVSLILTRFLRGMLYGVEATDGITFVVVPIVLALVALFATFLPARRASLVDPIQALRTE